MNFWWMLLKSEVFYFDEKIVYNDWKYWQWQNNNSQRDC